MYVECREFLGSGDCRETLYWRGIRRETIWQLNCFASGKKRTPLRGVSAQAGADRVTGTIRSTLIKSRDKERAGD